MDLKDGQWTILEPLIPKPHTRPDGRGRPWRHARDVLNGILWVVDGHGLPVAIDVASASPAEVRLVTSTLDARFIPDLPERLIGDKAYDSDALAEELADLGIQLISPHRKNRKNKTQDG